jgi:hypothetical protein
MTIGAPHEARESDVTERERTGGATIKRRGLIAGAAALVAGIVATKASQPVAAGSDGDIALNVFSDIYATTGVQAKDNMLAGEFSSGNWVGSPVLKGDASLLPDNQTYAPMGLYNVDGVQGLGKGTGTGVVGNGGANSGIGVYGFGAGTAAGVQGFGGNVLGAPGVVGVANTASANNGDGVRGFGANGGFGVAGKGGATNATGVIGFGGGSSGQGVAGIGAATGPGIVGVGGNFGATNNADGVQGFANGTGSGVVGYGGGTSGIGVHGVSTNGTGVHGSTSTGLYGVYGLAGSHQGAGGVVGVATTAGTIGFAGAAFAPATDAGHFTGNVSIFGSLGVSGAKYAVVKGGDGQYRGMYAVESPECWFEDFGKAKLVNGQAVVTIDPLFAQHVHSGDYHVFLTAYSDTNGLHVAGQSGAAFTVAEHNGGKNNLTFSWRVVARRADITGERLPIWEMPTPAFTKPEPPPPAPAPPAPLSPKKP